MSKRIGLLHGVNGQHIKRLSEAEIEVQEFLAKQGVVDRTEEKRKGRSAVIFTQKPENSLQTAESQLV